MRNILFSLVLIIAAFPAICHAEIESDYFSSQVDYQSGLSHSAVLSIFQDSDGLMWFGTYDGVNCYDGSDMTVYKSDFSEKTTLSNNVIHHIIQAPGNCLWVNTHLGLDLFSRDSSKVVSVYDFYGDYSIVSDTSGDTWVTSRDTLWYYNTSCRDFFPLDVPFHGGNDVGARSFVNESGELWHFPENSGKVNVYTVSSFHSDPASVEGDMFQYDFHSLPVSRIFYQSGIICFIDSQKNLYVYDVQKRSKIFIRDLGPLLEEYGEVSGIVPFYDDIVIGFKTSGLVRLKNSDSSSVEEVDRNLRIYGLYKDSRQGILWVATDGDGAVYYARKDDIAKNLMLQDLSANLSRQVRSIMTDADGNLWFGTKGDGLVKVPSAGPVFGGGRDETLYSGASVYFPYRKYPVSEYARSSEEFQVYAMCESRYHDGFWIGSGVDGLCWYSKKDDRLYNVRSIQSPTVSEIHALYEESDSVLYAASAIDGFHRFKIRRDGSSFIIFKDRKYTFYDKGYDINMFYPMISDGDSLLWLGSRGNGLVKFNKKENEYYVFSLKDMTGKSVNDILSLCLSENSRKLYVGTTSGLVTVSLDSTGTVSGACYTGREHGLLNDMIHGILEDKDGFLWLSTNRGLIKYNPWNRSSHTYYYSGGVEVGEFSDDAYFQSDRTGDMYFGGIDGLLRIDRKDSRNPAPLPDIVLRSIETVSGKLGIAEMSVEKNGVRTVALKGPKATFSVSYAVPDYLTGNDIEYSYKLDGYRSDWSVFSNSNKATFINVPAGDYIFRVRYKKDVFDTEYKNLSIPVSILYPWYFSPGMRILYVLLFVLSIVAIGIYVYKYGPEVPGPAARPAANPASPGMTGFLSMIYRNIMLLRSENVSLKDRTKAVDGIRSAVIGYEYQGILTADSVSGDCLSGPYAAVENTGISDLLKNILAETGKANQDIVPGIFGNIVFPVYRNAFSILFYYCFSYFRQRRADAKVTVAYADNSSDMKVTLAAADSSAADLFGILTGTAEVSCASEDDDAFVGSLVLETARKVVRQLGIESGIIESTGAGSCFEMIFHPAEQAAGHGTETHDSVLVMSGSMHIAWIIEDMLGKSFSVRTVRSMEEALEALRSAHFSVILTDMDMFNGRETDFLQQIHAHKPALSGMKFIPMFSWRTPVSVCRELLRISDSYVMLPYDVVLLKDVVNRTIYGKRSMVPLHLDELGSMAVELNCETNEDTIFAQKVLNVIDSELERGDLGCPLIADRMAMSKSQLFRRFKKVFNIAPETFIKNYRIEKASRLLKQGGLSIQEAMADVGISSRSYFNREFAAKFGVPPKEYMENSLH